MSDWTGKKAKFYLLGNICYTGKITSVKEDGYEIIDKFGYAVFVSRKALINMREVLS